MKPLYDPAHLRELRRQSGTIHSKYGDLNRTAAVVMPVPSGTNSYKERDFQFIHLSVTGRCNARCTGCINSMSYAGGEGERPEDTVPERDGQAVLKLLEASGDHRESVLCLYGGEPLLAMEKVRKLHQVLSGASHLQYMLYTNGQLLDRAVADYGDILSQVWLFSLSIDGREEQHNRIRRGTDLARIHKNLELLKPLRNAPVLMWSTLRESQSLLDCFEEFMELKKKELVEHFFWHWVETKEALANYGKFSAHYEADLRKIMDVYVTALAKGEVLSLVHINELILYVLGGKGRTTTGCGVEVDRNYDIMGGKIYPCADLPATEIIGTVGDDGTPHLMKTDLSQFTVYKNDLGCDECGVHRYCGGRCPVQGLTSEAERLVQYCRLMRIHVGVVLEYIPAISDLLEEQNITLQQLYDNSAFYAQFTDVTP